KESVLHQVRRCRGRQTRGQSKKERADAEVRVVKVDVEATPQHLLHVAMEIAIGILVGERPRGDLGSRRLLPHELEILTADGSVNGAEGDVLMFTHECDPWQTKNNRGASRASRARAWCSPVCTPFRSTYRACHPAVFFPCPPASARAA